MSAKTLCLGVLSRGEATGYEIRKHVTQGPFGHFFEASYGSIYPALNGLSAEALVECRAMAQERRPDKKVYRITPAGCLALVEALTAEPEPDHIRSEFTFMLFFGHLLSARHLDETISERVAWYRESIARMERCRDAAADRPAGELFTLGLGIATYTAAADYLEEHVHELLSEVLLSDEVMAAD
jgi:DNA-binding PadR family transcriptional regulator